MTLEAVLLFPLHLTVLVLLHTVFLCIRLVRFLTRLINSSSRHPTCSNPTTDLLSNRWKKLPRHLAVILSPRVSVVSIVSKTKKKWRLEEQEQEDLEIKLTELNDLCQWSRQLGIKDLTVYDRDGLLIKNRQRVIETSSLLKLEQDNPSIVTLVSSSSSSSSSSCSIRGQEEEDTTTSDGTSTTTLVSEDYNSTKSSQDFTLRLISRQAGRPQLAKLAQQLATTTTTSPVPRLSSSKISEIIDDSSSLNNDYYFIPEPDLIFIFGGQLLKLYGFPPWQIRLSEIYHYQTLSLPLGLGFRSLSFCRPEKLSYSIFRKSLDLYGRAEMRLGR